MTIKRVFEIYKQIRDKVAQVKEEVGFKCKMCGTCCTQNIPVIFEDYWYMKENNASLDGLKITKSEKGIIYGIEMVCDKIDRNTGICYYEDKENKKCSIHSHNPMLCHSFPFVCNLDQSQDDKMFFVHKSCSWMEENFDKFFIKLEQRDQILNLIHELREVDYDLGQQTEEKINEYLNKASDKTI